MKCFINKVCLLSSGVTFGIIFGAASVIAIEMSSNTMRGAFADVISDKIVQVLYTDGKSSAKREASKVSYKQYYDYGRTK